MGARGRALGPTLGALLTEYASWRWIFLINVPICADRRLSGSRCCARPATRTRRDCPTRSGVLLIAVMPALLSFAIIEGPWWGWSDPRVVGAFALRGRAAARLPVALGPAPPGR